MPAAEDDFFDRHETRPADRREAGILAALPQLIRHARDHAPGQAARLRAFDPEGVTDRAALARLPLLRKSDLAHLQRAALPFGGLAATPLARLARLFASPGPIYDPEGRRPDFWRFARALFAAGLRAGELVHNAFSYHLTPAGSMVESGCRALHCPVIPAGTAETLLQLKVIADLRPSFYAGTPSFLRTLLERGHDEGLETGSLTGALVSGEAFPPALRDLLQAQHGIAAYQCYATADLGLIAYETKAREGLVLDEAVLVEIVRPGTGDPVPDGEVGEVVVTAFNPDYPLIRFATGDLSAILPGPSPCGRTNRRIRGWLGRADQATKMRGMFVQPSQIADLLRRHPDIRRARLVVEHDPKGRDRMRLLAEAGGRPEGLAEALALSLRSLTGLRGEVELVAEGSLPNDGRVVDDRRPHG
jgi:phenylacetate-CoA ligase